MAVDLAATMLLKIEADEDESKWREAQLEMLSLAAVGGATRGLTGGKGKGKGLPRSPRVPPLAGRSPSGAKGAQGVIRPQGGKREEW